VANPEFIARRIALRVRLPAITKTQARDPRKLDEIRRLRKLDKPHGEPESSLLEVFLKQVGND
jgi:hypothetical protein